MKHKLKKAFFWGGSVTSFQTEGAAYEDGKGLSVYDTHRNSEGNPIWDTAIDFYHRYKEDITTMKDLGINLYRFSITWSRIQPDGETEINQKGIDFYNDLINELIKNGITPMICLNHYDIPLALEQKYNGFYSRKVVDLFEKFTKIVVDAYGDRVTYWMSFNEQNDYVKECTKASAKIVPEGMPYAKFLYQVNHNILIAHCKALKVIKQKDADAKVCGMCAMTNYYPVEDTPENTMYCYLADLYTHQFHCYVYTEGRYPSYMENYLKNHGWYPEFAEGDEEVLKNTVDFIGLSYYRSYTLKTGDFDTDRPFYDIIEESIVDNKHLESTEWGWPIDPIGLRYCLTDLYTRYQKPLLILESGLSHTEELDENDEVNDDYRIKYHIKCIEQMKKSMFDDGVDCFGYVTWGPFDQLSSSGDMRKRYGYVFVNRTNEDLRDLRRVKKKSYNYMKQIHLTNADNI